MRKQRNIIKWHYVTDKQDNPTGLRGWDERNEKRYELEYTPDGWSVVAVEFGEYDGLSDFNHVHYRHIKTGSIFECMQAVELYSDSEFNAGECEQ